MTRLFSESRPGGFPKLRGEWRFGAKNTRLIVELEQVQTDGALFRLPLEVGLRFDEGPKSRRERIDLTGGRQAFEIPVDRAPASVVLEPDLWVLIGTEFLENSAYPSHSTSPDRRPVAGVGGKKASRHKGVGPS